MKIITWNCNMAFRRKAEVIVRHKPDILVIQECEHPGKIKFSDDCRPNDMLWLGNNMHKGLGIFSYADYKLKLHKAHNPGLKLIAPVKVFNGRNDFLLYAIWAHNPGDKDGPYITQIWKALAHYKRLIRKTKTILAGDFNSNTFWDRPRREGNHSTVVQRLAKKDIHSVYHKYFNQEQGREAHATHYLYRHKDRPYHLDYCFASNDLVQNLQSVEIGDFDTWKPYSDHMPLMVTFGEPAV